MPREPMRHVVVLLPGILGSALRKDGRDVWAVSGGAAVSALLSLGGSIDRLTLAREARGWLQNWRAMSGAQDAKLILVAHSMGGLVSRHFLEVLDGWRDTRALLTFGTPYRGSVNALRTLVQGARQGPFGLVDLSGFVRSLTSIYQLLPTYECWNGGDGKLWRIAEVAGIPNVDRARAQAALAFHHEIRDAVARHERDDAYQRDRYRIIPIVGIEQPTLQSARLAGGAVEFLETYEDRDLRGDGTVPRVSATPLEMSRSGGETFAATAHASLQNADPVLVNLTGALLSLDIDLGAFKAAAEPPRTALGLRLEDLYVEGQPVTIRVRPTAETAPPLTAVVSQVGAAETARAVLAPQPDGSRSAELPPFGQGVYRVVVEGDATVQPVADVFTVFPRAAR